MKVYLAGPMRGYPKFNFPTFFKVAKKLEKQGFTVFNPADKDIKHYGSLKGVVKAYDKDPQCVMREVIQKDLLWIIQQADRVYVLPGWKKSRGVKAELALAKFLGLDIVYLSKKFVEEK